MLSEESVTEKAADSVGYVYESIEDSQVHRCESKGDFEVGFVVGEGHPACVVHGVCKEGKEIDFVLQVHGFWY